MPPSLLQHPISFLLLLQFDDILGTSSGLLPTSLSFSLCSILFRKEEERKTMNLWFCLGRRHTSCRKLFICMSTCLMSIGLSIYLSTYLHIINIYTTRYICTSRVPVRCHGGINSGTKYRYRILIIILIYDFQKRCVSI